MSAAQRSQVDGQSSRHRNEGKGLPRKRERDSEEPPAPPDRDGSQMFTTPSKKSRAKPPPDLHDFACPFAKRDPAKYGGANGCITYSKPIGTVLRHHVLDKHRKEYREAGKRDDIFEKLEQLGGKSGSKMQKNPEESWKKMFKILFEVDSSEEDNIPEPYIDSSSRDNKVENIKELLEANPFLTLKAVDFQEELYTLKDQRELAKRDIRQKAEIEMRKKVAAETQTVNAEYGERYRELRSRFEAALISASHTQTGIRMGSTSASTLGIEGAFGGFAQEASQPSGSNFSNTTWTPISAQEHADEPRPPHPSYQNTYFPHMPASTLEVSSDSGYQSVDRGLYCEHGISMGDLWCDACLGFVDVDGS